MKKLIIASLLGLSAAVYATDDLEVRAYMQSNLLQDECAQPSEQVSATKPTVDPHLALHVMSNMLYTNSEEYRCYADATSNKRIK